ncbi:MAG: hypothetical protein GXO80_03030 [Chlorobi bacterium]|nr:hypothetical protein [Chlorobiota bacterium]
MNKVLLTVCVIYSSFGFAFAQSQEYNYIKSTTFLSEDMTKSVTSISYTDGLGRPLQNIILGASPSGKDIVRIYQYDQYGKTTKNYMPFTNSNGQNGEFITNALSRQTAFYNSRFPNQNAYAEVEYDNSPYNRIVKQSSPGEDINNINVSNEFEPCGGLEMFVVNDNNKLIINGYYPENSLLKFTVKNKDGKELYIYKDKSGNVLLKEQLLNGTAVKTRYVYDKFGQLRYVLSPEAMSQITAGTYTPNSTIIKQYCYCYEYNAKHQLVTKQLPGKEPVYLRYDDKYRFRAVQNGNQRNDSLWTFINYDPLGRTISTGSAKLSNNTLFQDTINPSPINGISPFLTYQYYDNYNFISDTLLQFDPSAAYHEKFNRVKGKTTGSKVRVMKNNEEIWLTSVIYYDKYGRVIQTISQNNVGGYDIVSNKYNFAGELLESKQKHTDYLQETKFLVYLYDYDTPGRLLKIKLSQNEDAGNAVIINEMTYNELGQVKQKKIHSENGTDFLQTEDFGYNIKGAVTNINNPDDLGTDLFGMNLFYDTKPAGFNNTVYKDGKISAVQWNSKNLNQTKTYTYKYDDLNRLTRATYTPQGRYNVNIQYDLNGNITRLNRKGEIFNQTIENGLPTITKTFGTIDSLTYNYNGNKLLSVQDAAGDFNTNLNNDFRDNSSFSAEEYFYDANGNMNKDRNKGIDTITYNRLNQPAEVNFGTQKTVYTYTATGMKLKTQTYENGNLKNTTEYSGAFVYENNTLSYINIPGGRIVAQTNEYQYNLTDHLGNVRLTFTKDTSGTAKIIQEDHYYPFGMRISGQHFSNTDLINKYLYNGKELQDQTLYLDYGLRQMDAQLGRWHVADAMAESYFSESPYSYAGNDPINKYDVLGLKYYWKREEWQQESHFGGGIMDFINNLNNHMWAMLNTGRGYAENMSLTGTVNGVQGTSVNNVLTFNFNDNGTFSMNIGQNFSGFYGHDNTYIYSLFIDGIGRFNFKNGVKISSVIGNGNVNWGNVSNKIAYGATTAEFLMGLANIAEKDINLAKAVKVAKLYRTRGIVIGAKYVEYARYAQYLKNQKLLVKAGYVTSGIAEFTAYIQFELSEKKRSDYTKFGINTASNILTAIPNPWTIGIGLLIGAGDYAGLYDGLYNFLDNPVRNVNYNYLAEPNW